MPANHANAQEPSFARVILATVIPSVINVAEVNKDLLAMESAAAPSDDLTANESRLQPEAASTRRPTRQTTRGTAGASAQSTGSGGTRTRTHGFDVGVSTWSRINLSGFITLRYSLFTDRPLPDHLSRRLRDRSRPSLRLRSGCTDARRSFSAFDFVPAETAPPFSSRSRARYSPPSRARGGRHPRLHAARAPLLDRSSC